jgi:phosphotriesterase-related protein
MTVRGPIDPADIGTAFMHEHLYTDFIGFGDVPAEARKLDWSTAAEARWNPLGFPENGRFTNVDLIVSELAFLKAAGGNTIVDVTPIVLHRNPSALVEISYRSGLHVVMGGGYFTEPFHPPHIRLSTAEELADEFVAEALNGVDDTGIRPGILGELGAGDPFTDEEAKLLRANAWTGIETGLALTVHVQPLSRVGPAVLDVLLAEHLAPERIVLGHMTPMIADDRYQRSLLDRGPFLAYDFIGMVAPHGTGVRLPVA